MIGNYVMSRRSGKESYATRLKKYEEARARIETEADEAVVAERTARRSWFPDPAAVLLTAVGPRRRLWERRTSDTDFLELRVGTADQPSDVVLQDPTVDEHRRQLPRVAFDVPVTVGLRGHRVLGIAGRSEAVRAVARWVVGQAAILHSPRDLQLYVLTGPGGERDWAWVRWLPHVRPRPGQDTVITVGTDTESAARRVSELTALITARTAAGATTGQQDVLVVLDGARRLRSLPGIVQILRDGPSVGVHAVCLDDEERLLPEECQAVVVEEPGGTLRIGRSGVATLTGVRPDRVTADWCRSVGRALGPLRDPGGSAEEASVLPGAARLLDVLSLDPPTAEAVAGRWRAGGRTTSAVVGVSLDGPFALDLRRDGPHGLVAGTTGSGKSELLQTLVASLAVGNRPDAMTFVLVDYKGGSAFKDCVSLPHTVGMVTDLDAHLVERALTSLSAELKRREHILAGAGAKDIEDYIDLLVREPHRPPLPRLLIVIDEFASMVRELPDFVKGLVNIAQRGRSLGIHLILATQRPGGVVSPEIRANTNLRIALRVTDRSESQDVINSPESAGISKSHPGRAHVRLGQTSLVPFQAGRVGGRRPGAAADASAPAPWVVPVGWGRLGAPLPPRPRVARTESDTAVTDLADLVEAVRGANRELGVPQQHSPWLPALPATLVLDDLPAPAPGPYDLPPVPYGLVDLPAEQAQLPCLWTCRPSAICTSSARRGPAGRRPCAPSRAPWPARTPAPICICTASTAATAPYWPWKRCRTRAPSSSAPSRSAWPGCSPGSPPKSRGGRSCWRLGVPPICPSCAAHSRPGSGPRTSWSSSTGGRCSTRPSPTTTAAVCSTASSGCCAKVRAWASMWWSPVTGRCSPAGSAPPPRRSWSCGSTRSPSTA